MKQVFLAFVAFSALVLSAKADTKSNVAATAQCSPGDTDYLTVNPLGTCFCKGQLWVGENCRTGFYCPDAGENEGCYKECDIDEFLLVSVVDATWKCQNKNDPVLPPPNFVLASELASMADSKSENGFVMNLKDLALFPELFNSPSTQRFPVKCPIGGFDICPPTGDPAPVPNPDDVTENPLGTCRCNGELWVSQGCSYGFVCDDTLPKGGEMQTCPENEVLTIDWETMEWTCTSDPALCPGEILGIGCPQPNCEYGQKEECACEGQFFIDDECGTGFYCTDNIPDPYIYDGCVQKCLEGQALVPDFANKDWQCVDKDDFLDFQCPGKFNFECPENDVGSDFDGSTCECNHQIIISADCTEGFYCFESTLLGKGLDIKCPAGQVVDVNVVQSTWRCVDDDGSCPGLGGYKVGCDGGTIRPPQTDCTAVDVNTIGDCSCGGQIFSNEDCDELFYCFNGVTTEGKEGCTLKCEEGKVAILDIIHDKWECVDKPDNYVCPGKFNTNCPGESFQPECGCQGEVWMNEDCTEAFLCSEAKGSQGNVGSIITCDPGTFIEWDLSDGVTYECNSDPKICPGSYNFGCKGGNLPVPDSSTSVAASVLLVGVALPTLRLM